MKKTLITLLVFVMVQPVFSEEKMEDLTLEYQAISRGSYLKMTLNEQELVFNEDSSGKNSSTIKVTDKQWKEIVNLVSKIKLKELPYLKAPSDKRKYDGAAHTLLKISIKDKVYESSGFDHGNPPKEIKNLVEYISDISESMKKTQ